MSPKASEPLSTLLVLLAATLRGLDSNPPKELLQIPLSETFLKALDDQLLTFGPEIPGHDPILWKKLVIVRSTLEKILNDEVLRFVVDPPPEGTPH